MPTDPNIFVARGMPAELATEVASQIDLTKAVTSGYPSATRLMGFGVSAPLANVMAAQFSDAANLSNLMGLGVPPLLGEAIVAAIDAQYP